MNKAELIAEIAAATELSKRAAGEALDATLAAISKALARKDGKVSLPGFGTFKRRERAARTGRNPKTGEPLNIKAAIVPAFTAGSQLKEDVQKGQK